MATPVVYGDRGPLVLEMQKYLKSKGYNPGTLDGVWGPNTQKAVDAFKKAGGSMPWGTLQKKIGSSGGGGSSSKNNPPSIPAGPADRENDIINRLLSSQFGPLIKPFVKVPELRRLIVNLAPVAWGGKGWSEERFMAAVQGTSWWEGRTQTRNEWSTLSTAEKDARIREVGTNMFSYLQQSAGQDWVVKKGYADMFKRIDDPGGKLRFWAHKVASGDMSFEEWQVSMTQKLLKDPTSELSIIEMQRREEVARLAKRPEEMAEEIWQQAHGEYFLGMSKKSAKKWADDIIGGKASFGELKDYFRKQAAMLYKGYAKAINNGVLPRELFGPALTVLSNELEMSEEQIIADHGLWGEIVAQAGGNKEHFSASDWIRYARNNSAWKHTRGADQMQADFKDKLLKQFGAIA